MREKGEKLIANNKKVYHDYFIEEVYEAGIALVGTEVKALREGHCSIKEAFIGVEDGEIFIHHMHVNPYEKGNIFNRDPLRKRKLLLHKVEIRKLAQKREVAGYTIVPTRVYFKNGKAKVEIALARGKKLYDKRDTLAKKDAAREAERDFKIRNIKI
ncbi:MAG: SsrA-binding protein SmpB [Eubacterium sp.]|nr:SsrA-binding protein SmpB [Eubacterium sp.]